MSWQIAERIPFVAKVHYACRHPAPPLRLNVVLFEHVLHSIVTANRPRCVPQEYEEIVRGWWLLIHPQRNRQPPHHLLCKERNLHTLRFFGEVQRNDRRVYIRIRMVLLVCVGVEHFHTSAGYSFEFLPLNPDKKDNKHKYDNNRNRYKYNDDDDDDDSGGYRSVTGSNKRQECVN